MEYVEYLDTYSDVPVDTIIDGWKKIYGEDRVNRWIDEFERSGGKSGRNFIKEDILE